MPLESTSRGSSAVGTPRSSEHVLVPRRAVEAEEPGDGGVRRVGDVQLAARQVPRQPRVDRAEAAGDVAVRGPGRVGEHPRQLGGRLVGRQRDAVLGAHREALADRAEVLPAERRARSARRSARSHTIVLARWLVMPTARDRLGPPRRSPRRRRRARAGPARRRRTRRARGTAWRGRTVAGRGPGSAARRPRSPPAGSLVPDVDEQGSRSSTSPRHEPAAAQLLAEQAADEAGGEHRGQVEEHGEPWHVVTAEQADRWRRRPGPRCTCRPR